MATQKFMGKGQLVDRLAAQVYNISHSFISMVCAGKRTSDKYNFKYLKNYEQEKCLTVNI